MSDFYSIGFKTNFNDLSSLRSVKLPGLMTSGKNTWSNEIFKTCPIAKILEDGSLLLNGTLDLHWMFNYTIDKGTYSSSIINNFNNAIHMFWSGGDGLFEQDNPFTFTEPTVLQGYVASGTYNNVIVKLQLEHGTSSTPYEPYQSNILKTLEPIELRSMGDVKDTLNVLTGEVVNNFVHSDIKQISSWTVTETTNTVTAIANSSFDTLFNFKSSGVASSNGLMFDRYSSADYPHFRISCGSPGRLVLYIGKDELSTYDSMGVSEWVNDKSFTVVAEATEPTIKTVGLSIEDHDGNEVDALTSYNHTTHINTFSEGLNPEFNGLVATGEYTTPPGTITGPRYVKYSGNILSIKDSISRNIRRVKMYGETLVNLYDFKSLVTSNNISLVPGGFKCISLGTGSWHYASIEKPGYKDKTVYTFIINIKKNTFPSTTPVVRLFRPESTNGIGYTISGGVIGLQRITITTDFSKAIDSSGITTNIGFNFDAVGEIEIDDMILLEGDFSSRHLKYFEGMRSLTNPEIVSTNGENEFTDNSGSNIPNASYKANISKVISDKSFGSINESIYDEIDVSGNSVTFNTTEIVLTGDENWTNMILVAPGLENVLAFYIPIQNSIPSGNYASVLCNKLSWSGGSTVNVANGSFNACSIHANGNFYIRILKSIASNVTEFKQWLKDQYNSGDPVTIRYQLETPIIEPLEISIKDQDNLPTTFSSFNGTTNLFSKSNYLLPKFEGYVATGEYDNSSDEIPDYRYVKYDGSNITINDSVERPIKSAILMGNTLVQLVPSITINYTASTDYDGYNGIGQTNANASNAPRGKVLQDLKPNTQYTIICNVVSCGDNGGSYRLNNSNADTCFTTNISVTNATLGVRKFLLTTRTDITSSQIALRPQNYYCRGKVEIKDIMIIEGDYTNVDIPYFTGMQSTKLPVLRTYGKNLVNNVNIAIDNFGRDAPNNVLYVNGGFEFELETPSWKSQWYDFHLVAGEKYVVSYESNFMDVFIFKSKVTTYFSSEVVGSKSLSNKDVGVIQKKYIFIYSAIGWFYSYEVNKLMSKR